MRTVVYWCLLCAALPATAEVYRWVDGAGKTHYGDRAPPEQHAKATRMHIEAETTAVDPEAERARQQLRSIEEGRQRARAFEAQKVGQEQERQQQLAQRCQSLRNEMRNDQNIAVFYRYDEKGNRVLWSAEERLAYRENLQNLKQTYCPD